jgi:nucleotide-binding universal stress UspA family protein
MRSPATRHLIQLASILALRPIIDHKYEKKINGVGEPGFSQLAAERDAAGQRAIDEAAHLVGDGVDIRRELLFGSGAESLIAVAETRQCDLIVMGTRGLGALRGLLLGSQAQKVVSLAPCPVLLVK